MPESIAQLCLY